MRNTGRASGPQLEFLTGTLHEDDSGCGIIDFFVRLNAAFAAFAISVDFVFGTSGKVTDRASRTLHVLLLGPSHQISGLPGMQAAPCSDLIAELTLSWINDQLKAKIQERLSPPPDQVVPRPKWREHAYSLLTSSIWGLMLVLAPLAG